jgi:(S)-2-hydroxyglutarate dehydrogenase
VYDYIVIGGGIVGLATAWQLKKQAKAANIAVLEKEADWALHQTGRNSGVCIVVFTISQEV